MSKLYAFVLLSVFVLLVSVDAKPQFYGAQQTAMTKTVSGPMGTMQERTIVSQTPMGYQSTTVQRTVNGYGYRKK